MAGMKKEKKKCAGAVLTVLTVGGILAGLTAADLFTADRLFSAFENRMLAQRPEFSVKALFAGTYTEAYETYVTDQFVGRDRWITVKTLTDVALGKKEINGVYLAADGTLIEKHAPEDYDGETEDKKIMLLKGLAERQEQKGERFSVMLVPTADQILSDKLPAHATGYDQLAFIEKVSNVIGDDNVINTTSLLNAHKDEYIYYGTDHHWTTLGAYYGYLAWAEHMNMTNVSYEKETVSEDFYGTLHSKTHVFVKADRIESYLPSWQKDGGQVEVYYDGGRMPYSSLYAPEYLSTKNQYGYFLKDNHALIEIRRNGGNAEEGSRGRTLFVIRDSYASCFLPFLTEHYDTILVLDPRYYNGSLFTLLDEYEEREGNMDVLVLYNVIHFLEEFRYYDRSALSLLSAAAAAAPACAPFCLF